MLTPGDAQRQALPDQCQPSSDNLTAATYGRLVSGVGFRPSLRRGRRAWADESVEAPYPGRGQRPGHRTVVPLARYGVKQLVVVHHREHRHRRGDQAERPVVVPATGAESEAAVLVPALAVDPSAAEPSRVPAGSRSDSPPPAATGTSSAAPL